MKSHYYGPRERSRLHLIPIYECLLEVVASGSLVKSRNTPRRIKMLGGRYDDADECQGFLSHNGWKMGLFLDRNKINHNLIAHEVFHATHRIMEHCSVVIGKKHHEAPALLNGYLAELVYQDLKRWKIKV